MIENLLSGKWNKNTTTMDTIMGELIDAEGTPMVVPTDVSRVEDRYQSLLNELRNNHRLPVGGLRQLAERKDTHFPILFSREGRIYLKSVSAPNMDVKERLQDQIRLLWKYLPELITDMDPATIRKYGSNHPIYRVHLLEDDPYFSSRFEGCFIMNGSVMIQNYYAVVRKELRVNHRLWTTLDTDHGPEFFLERGLGVHRIYKLETPPADEPLQQISENDFPSQIQQTPYYQTRDNMSFELVPV